MRRSGEPRAGTLCFNTDPGYACNCDIDGVTWYFDDGSGGQISAVVSVNSGTAGKATVTVKVRHHHKTY